MIGIYVGTFNPITKGHKKVSEMAIDKFNLEKVVFVPVSNQYNKNGLLDFNYRKEMIKLAIKDNDKLTFSNIEQIVPKQLKTYETLRLLKKLYKDDLALIIGADNLIDLPNWANVSELLTKYKIIVFNRGHLPLNFLIKNHSLLNKHKDNIFVVEKFDDEDISSTKVRDNINNEVIENSLLQEEVYDYIKENKLYA